MPIKKSIFAAALGLSIASQVATFTPIAYAETSLDSVRYWSVNELETLKLDFEAESDIACAAAEDKAMCKDDLIFSKMGEDSAYVALYSYTHMRFMVTRVNPSKNQVSIYYNGYDDFMSQMEGYSVTSEIDDMYMVWVDQDATGDPSINLSWLTYGYRYPYHLGDSAEEHSYIIFDENADHSLEPGWFPQGQEVTFTASNGDLRNNTSGRLYFSARTDIAGSTLSDPKYTDCLNSSDYVDGMECRIAFSEDGMMAYLPFVEEQNAPDDIQDNNSDDTPDDFSDVADNTESPDDAQNIDNSTDTPSDTTENSPSSQPTTVDVNAATEAMMAQNNTKATTDSEQISENTSLVVSSISRGTASDQAVSDRASVVNTSESANNEPENTNDNTINGEGEGEISSASNPSDTVEIPLAAGKREEKSFPWWLVALAVAGIGLACWWFIPSRHKKSKQ